MQPPLRVSLGLLLVVGLACAASSNRSGEAPPPPESAGSPLEGDLLPAEVTTIGWDALSNSPVVLLRELESGQVLPIWIGLAEARAIGLALHGIEPPRPMTHDLMVNLLSNLDARLEEVLVSELRGDTYYALLKLWVAGEGEPRWIDSRPSDGLALALRTGAAIRISARLLDELPEYQFLAPDSSEQVVRALGLTVAAVDDELREEFSLPDRAGIVVIAASGAAERRGLRRGDLIVEINGRPPSEPLDLLEAISDDPDAETLRITYWRDGEETTVELPLESPEPSPSESGKIA
ncbi:MAG: PDZ domain-containing protein [bacterium]|nr:PDZ domain-containing protein [bacterium]